MKYFDNGRDRSVFRVMAVGRKEWYDQKCVAYARLAFSSPAEFSEVQYFEYVAEQRNLELYIAALDAEDISEGSLSVGGSVVVESPVVVGEFGDMPSGLLSMACQLYHSGFAMFPDEERNRIIGEAREWYMVYCQLLK